MVFIDAHTHCSRIQDGVRVLLNLRCRSADEKPSEQSLNSAGVHPWDSDMDGPLLDAVLANIGQMAAARKIVAVGECGLDRLRGAALDRQQEVFIRQLEIADAYALPCVIHCVRAYPELLAVRKKYPARPWIIHAFRGSREIAEQLVKHGCSLSFGASLLHSKGKNIIASVPADRILLESDDSGSDIIRIYERASELLDMDVSGLCGIVSENFKRIFDGIWKETDF